MQEHILLPSGTVVPVPGKVVAQATEVRITIGVIIGSASSIGTIPASSTERIREERDEEEWDAIVQSAHGKRVLRHLLREARREIASGKTYEGGFGFE